MSQNESLWVAAKRQPWEWRPLKADMSALSTGMGSDEAVEGVFMAKWSAMFGCALAVTSHALYLAQETPFLRMRGLLKRVPPEFRAGPGTVRIPRFQITGITLAEDAVSILLAARGELSLPLPPRLQQEDLLQSLYGLAAATPSNPVAEGHGGLNDPIARTPRPSPGAGPGQLEPRPTGQPPPLELPPDP